MYYDDTCCYKWCQLKWKIGRMVARRFISSIKWMCVKCTIKHNRHNRHNGTINFIVPLFDSIFPDLLCYVFLIKSGMKLIFGSYTVALSYSKKIFVLHIGGSIKFLS